MIKRILILGGTGVLGAAVARCLRAEGFRVRLLARNPKMARHLLGDEFEIYGGDAVDPLSMERALRGCQGLHISLGEAADRAGTENAAWLASKTDIQKITYVSGTTVAPERTWFPLIQDKLAAEAAISSSKIPYIIFCPSWAMETLQNFYRAGRIFRFGRGAVPFHWFAAEDMGRMVARSYRLPEAQGLRLYIHGPEMLTLRDALEDYRRSLHPEVKTIIRLPLPVARAIAFLTRNQGMGAAVDLLAYFEKAGELGDPSEANLLLGAPTTTLELWLAQQQHGLHS